MKNVKKYVIGLFIISGSLIAYYFIEKYRLQTKLKTAYAALLHSDRQAFENNLHSNVVNHYIKTKPNTFSTLLIQAIILKPDDPQMHMFIKRILETKGIDPNLAEYTLIDNKKIVGRAPIHWAVERGNEKAVELLAKAGADLNKIDPTTGKSPLAFVRSEKNSELRKEWHLNAIEQILLANRT